MYWQARHDNRHQQSKDLYPPWAHGFTESDKRAFGNGRTANGRGAIQRERLFILQSGEEAAKSTVV